MNERENGQIPIFRDSEIALQGSVDKTMAREIAEHYEDNERRQVEAESVVMRRIDRDLVHPLASELFADIGRAKHNGQAPEVLTRLQSLEAIADSMEERRPRISDRELHNRKFKKETLDDMRDRKYITAIAGRRAGQAKAAMAGFPEEETARARAESAVKGRQKAIENVAVRRMYQQFPDLRKLADQLHEVPSGQVETDPQGKLWDDSHEDGSVSRAA